MGEKVADVADLSYFIIVRDQIVMEGLVRAVAETSAVGKETEFFAVVFAPGAEHFDCFKIALEVAADVETVKLIRQIFHSGGAVNTHVDGGTHFDIGEEFLYCGGGKGGGGGHDFGAETVFIQMIDGVEDLSFKLFGDGIAAVTVAVDEQIKGDAFFADDFKFVFGLFDFIGQTVAFGASGSETGIGKIDFTDAVGVITDKIREKFSDGDALITCCKLHNYSPQTLRRKNSAALR